MSAAPARIAVLKPCCIGDSVMALPALDTIAACRPGATVDIFCGNHSKPIFENNPAVSRVHEIPDIPTWRDVLPLARSFRRGNYDQLVLLDRSRYLHLAARFSGTRHVHRPAPMGSTPRHESDIYLQVVRSAGYTPVTEIPAITPPQPDRDLAASITKNFRKPFIAIHPGGAENPGTTMVSKRWPAENFAEILNWASARGLASVLTGGPADLRLCRQVTELSAARDMYIVAGSVSLMQSAAVVERAALYVGVDTGMSHIAAAVGAPTVAIFGPTNPLRYGPRGERVVILAPPESERIPDADLRRQSDAHALPATTLITVADVLRACEGLIGQPERAAQ